MDIDIGICKDILSVSEWQIKPNTKYIVTILEHVPPLCYHHRTQHMIFTKAKVQIRLLPQLGEGN